MPHDRMNRKSDRIVALAAGPAVALGLMLPTGIWALQFTAPQPAVPLIWPVAAIALAVTYRCGWTTALGVTVGTAWLHTRLGADWPAALAQGVLTGSAGIVTAAVLRHFHFHPGLARVRDALLLLAVGGGLTAAVSAAGGALLVSGFTPALLPAFGLSWIADAMGLVLLAPPLLAARLPVGPIRRVLEAGAWVLLGALFVLAVYAGGLMAPLAHAASYAVFPLVLAVALRFGAGVTGLAVTVFSGVALACTAIDLGPFAHADMVSDLLSLHAHLAMLALTGLLLASARTERDAINQRAREHLRALASAGRMNAMSSMAAGIAHEINQPLSAVTSYAQAAQRMLRAGRDSEEIDEALARVVKGNERAAAIVRRVRGFLRSGSGERETVDLTSLVRDGIELTLPEYRRCRVNLTRRFTSHALPVHVDSVAIRQVVVNLLQNALEAMLETEHDARATVRVATRFEPDGHWCEFTVADDGPGLPAEGRSELFEPLVTTRADGTGLGLAIARSLVEAHDGTIEAEDTATDGALFRVRLPAALQHGKAE